MRKPQAKAVFKAQALFYKETRSERSRISKIHKKAENEMNRAIKDGLLARLPCSVCGEIQSQGHHADYEYPLEVIWLCQKHHSEVHANINKAHGLGHNLRFKEAHSKRMSAINL